MLSKVIVIGPLQVNCYLIGCEETREIIIVDPGDDAASIRKVITKENLIPKSIISTHGHIDHVGDVSTIQKLFAIPYYIHADEQPLIDALPTQVATFGLHLSGIPTVSEYLVHGQTILIGSVSLTVLHTPGHSPGGICLKADSCVFTGDTLFAGSVGRCDLPGGDWELLLSSIHTHLMSLPDQITVYPGHGPPTSIGRERRMNPYLSVS